MQLDQIAAITVNHLFGHLIRRTLTAIAVLVLAIIAIYHFTIAGTMALDAQYGALNARLIVAGIYTAAALIALAIWWMMRARPVSTATPTLSQPREMQLVMLVEAVMLGYSLARRGERAR